MIPHPFSSYGMHGQNEYANGAPVVPAELTGYRRWTLRPAGLTGNWGVPWPTDALDAVCLDRVWKDIDRDEYLELLADPDQNPSEIMMKVRDVGAKFTRKVPGPDIPDGVEQVVYQKYVIGRQHDAPHHNRQDRDDDCKCGIYCGYDIDGLQHTWVTSPSGSYVGVVKASGATICGKIGFRTARARMVALCVGLDEKTEAMFHQGHASTVYLAPDGERTPLEGANSGEMLADLVDRRRRALAGFPQYAGVQVYEDMNEMCEAFPPDDLRALGIER
jgi:hypothetical protein